MAFFSQVGLMLWKNWILQRRRICVSILEIILPLLLAVLLLLLRRVIFTEQIDDPTVYRPRQVEYSRHLMSCYNGWESELSLSNRSCTVGFAPAGKEVQAVMSYVQALNIKDVGNTSNFGKTVFKDFVNEEAMEDYTKDHPGKAVMCITFLNVEDEGNEELPRDLRFSIRPPTDSYFPWNTRNTYETAEQNLPRRSFLDYESVIYFQKLVGESLIKYWLSKSGNDTDQVQLNISSQRMAFPPYIKDPMIAVVQQSLPTVLILSLIISVTINTKNLVYEKEKKLKESMKLMGLLPSAHWVSWFITFCIYLVPIILLFAIFLGVPIMGDNGAILQKSDTSVVFVFLLAYGLATITFSFMIASMVQKANVASALSGILFFLTFTPRSHLLEKYAEMTKSRKLSFSLLSNCAMIFGGNIIGLYEGTGEGVQWNNFSTPATVDDNLSLLDCILMLLLDSALHLIVFWYLDNVRPGEFGVPKPYYFCFTKSYWCGLRKETTALSGENSDGGEKMLRFENEPTNLKAGIEISGLTKVFDKKTAVDSLSLNMYEGQITVLLGHNGAGKTTTMSVLTGFIPPSSGSAVVNGYDIANNLQGVRSSLGLCPQHNILFDTLTVKEHLQLFARLKGATNKQAEKEIDPLLTEVGLQEKKNEQSQKLSGGQKRKLSVAIALIAGSKIVILDEPSSGMDPGARRQTWDVLQKHRDGRTMLLTTHYMDEADVLGDRIAIMAEGVVKCCGSSMFLKKLYGAGYHLVVVKQPSCVVNNLTEVITTHVDTAKLETIINQEVTYLLSDKETAKFPALFKQLEEQKEELGINSFGTSATTMEEVFLKVGESAYHHDNDKDDATGNIQDNKNASGASFDPSGASASEKTPLTEEGPGLVDVDGTSVHFSSNGDRSVRKVDANDDDVMKFAKGFDKNKGLALELGKMRGIFVKKALHTWRNRAITLAQLLLPVVFACLALGIDRLQIGLLEDPPLTLDLAKFDPTIVPTTPGFNATPSNKRLEELYGQQFDGRQDVQSFQLSEHATYDNYTLKQAKAMGTGTFNKRVIVGLEVTHYGSLNKVQAVSHYNGQPLHSEPIGINYLMNAILQLYLNESYGLQAILHPLPMDAKKGTHIDTAHKVATAFGVALLISFGMAFLTALFVYYYIKERQVGAKHLQVVSGVSPLTYWLPTFLWDMLSYLVPCVCLLIVFAAYDMTAYCGGTRPSVIFLHLLMYGWAVLPFMYTLQFLFTSPATGVNVIIIFNVITGLVCLLVISILSIPSLKLESTAEILDKVFMLFFPNYSMAQGFVDIYTNYHTNVKCQNVSCVAGTFSPCCKDLCGDYCYEFETNFLSMNQPGIGVNILVFFITGIFYFLLVFLVEYHILQKIVYKIVRMFSKPDDPHNVEANQGMFQDSDVLQEREKINSSTPAELTKTDSLLLVNLYKKYGKLAAVDHTCLAVPKEECFGLLGQNGAGKTTTFKMLTGDVMVSGGNAYLDGYDICSNVKKVQSNMGYCPQFDALLDQMTGRETLMLYGRLRGVSEKHLGEVVNNLIDVLTLTPHADKLAGTYSGGNKRKLSTAISLVGMPDFIMLDEPSAGLDPKGRRQLWNVLSHVRALGHTLILTSHSMEECDALCTRLAIMVNGRFVCLGSPQHLKNKFGEGYTLIVQMGLSDDGMRQPIEPLVSYIAQYMPDIKVFDDHQGYVHFQVPDSKVKLADVFSMMEATKQYFNIRDYSVHQTTLEQIFLTFTRTQSVAPEKKKSCDYLSCLFP